MVARPVAIACAGLTLLLAAVADGQTPRRAAAPAGFQATGTQTQEGVELRWTRTPSSASRLAVQRYEIPQGWRTVSEVSRQATRFVDSEVRPQRAYVYRIEAVDRSDRKSSTPPVCVAVVPEVSLNPNATVTLRVTNEAELREAARRASQSDVRILIDREVVLTDDSIGFASDQHGVLIEGTGPAAALRFTWRWDGRGDWGDRPGRNGLEFRNRETIVRGLRIVGYEGAGSALKHNGNPDRSRPAQFTVVDCHFAEIGNRAYPFRNNMPVARINTDVWYTNAIASHADDTHTLVAGCTFANCCTNSFYGHCLYLTTNNVVVVNNRFVDCGHAIVAGGPEGEEFNLVLGNEIVGTRPEIDRTGQAVPPYLIGLSRKPQAFAFNRVSGQFRSMFRLDSAADMRRHHIDHNDYRGVDCDVWAGPGNPLNARQWHETGFDANSQFPNLAIVR
jgi:hypothetical protein